MPDSSLRNPKSTSSTCSFAPLSRLASYASVGLAPDAGAAPPDFSSTTSERSRGLSVLLTILAASVIVAFAPSRSFGQQSGYSSSAPAAVSSSDDSASGASGGAFSFKDKKNEFGFWIGSSLGLPSALGASHDRSFPILIGLRYGRVLVSSRIAALEYTFDIVPVAVVSEPKDASTGFPELPGGRLHVYGAGVAPVGFKLILRPERRIRPYVAVSSGPFYFSRQVPVVNSSQFNFYSTADLGFQVFATSSKAVSIGYKIGHLSNAGTGHLNPGFNSSSVYFGFSIFK